MENIMLTAIILALTFLGSRWIDFLYELPTAPLTFPDAITSRAKFRKPLLALILFVAFWNLAEVEMPLRIFLMAANFFLALIIFTDFEQYTIFDRMLLPFALIGILATIQLELPVIDRILAAIFGGGIFLLIAFVTRGGIGGGDIKLVAVLGIWLGVENLLNVITIACVTGGLVALILILTGKKSRQSYFAYGPYFSLAAMWILYCAKNL